MQTKNAGIGNDRKVMCANISMNNNERNRNRTDVCTYKFLLAVPCFQFTPSFRIEDSIVNWH